MPFDALFWASSVNITAKGVRLDESPLLEAALIVYGSHAQMIYAHAGVERTGE
jgi:hypothetical protein